MGRERLHFDALQTRCVDVRSRGQEVAFREMTVRTIEPIGGANKSGLYQKEIRSAGSCIFSSTMRPPCLFHYKRILSFTVNGP